MAPKGQTTQRYVKVHWRGETYEIEMPERQMSEANFEELLRVRVPGIPEARSDIGFRKMQTYYWAKGMEIDLQELALGE
jgi:hypothetical protein